MSGDDELRALHAMQTRALNAEAEVERLTAENARLGQRLSKINELAMNPGLVLDRVQRIAALSDQSKPAGAASSLPGARTADPDPGTGEPDH